MNNLDVILENIINKAKEEETRILDKAKRSGKESLDKKVESAQSEAKKIIDQAKKEKDLILENEKVSAQRQARDINISAKNKVIDEILKKLEDALNNMDNDTYKKFVLNALKDANILDGEILLEKNRKDIFSKEDLNNLKISEESCDHGFIIRKENIEYDNSFESLIKDNKDELRKEISDKIFKWGD